MRPPIELMKTIRPRALRISGSIACVTATCAIRLTSSWLRKSSSGIVSSGAITAMPALLTRPSSPRLATASPICSADSGDLVGIGHVEHQRHEPLGRGVAQARGVLLACARPAKTRQPSASMRRALARPMPVEAPVIRTDFTGPG